MTSRGAPEGVPIEALLPHREWVRALARRRLLDPNDADDLEQDVWRMALERPPRDARALRAWLSRVVRNAATSATRKRSTRSGHEAGAAPRVPVQSPAEAVAEAELLARLAQAVVELDEPYRTVAVLRWSHGLEATEIATRLSVPVETVRTRLKRALKLLRARVETLVDGDGDALCLLLVGLRFDSLQDAPAATTATAATTASTAITGGVLAMGVGAKVTTAAVIAVGALLWWVWPGDESVPPIEDGPAKVAVAPEQDASERGGRARVGAEPVVASTGTEMTATDPSPEEPVDGEIVSGRVVDAETGEPVAGATVSLVWAHHRAPESSASSVSAEDGTFRIPGATPGTFGELRLQAEGYADCFVKKPWKERPLELERNDAGDVPIHRGRTVTGRVVAADGVTPVADASLRLWFGGGGGSQLWIGEAREHGTTGGDGSFRLERIAPTHAFAYTLFAITSDGIGWSKLPGNTGLVDASDIEVKLRPSVAARVIVRDAAGAAQEGLHVVALPRFDPLGPAPTWEVGLDVYLHEQPTLTQMFSGQTDAQGVASFGALPSGPGSPVYDFALRGGRVRGHTRSRVAAAAVTEVEITAEAPMTRVVTGRVLDAGGVAIADAFVRCGAFPQGTRSGADGSFRMEGVTRVWGRNDWIAAEADGFARWEQRLRTTADQSEAQVEITLLVPAPISGQVVDENERGLRGALISRRLVGGPRDQRLYPVDDDGRFTFDDTTAGEWLLQVMAPPPRNRWELPAAVTVQGGQSGVVIRLRRADRGTARVEVTVVDEDGGPLAPDQVTISPVEPSRATSYATHGEVELGKGRVVIDEVRTGNWILWLRFPDRLGTMVPFDVAEGQGAVELRAVVRRPGVIRGRVDATPTGGDLPPMVMPQRVGVVSVPRWAEASAPKWHRSAPVGEDGRFEIPDVLPGRWRIVVRNGDVVGDVVVDVPPGGTADCTLPTVRAASLQLRIASPPENATVEPWLAYEGEPLQRWGTFTRSEDGTLVSDLLLVPGRRRWRVSFSAEGSWGLADLIGETQAGDVELVSGETTVIDVPFIAK